MEERAERQKRRPLSSLWPHKMHMKIVSKSSTGLFLETTRAGHLKRANEFQVQFAQKSGPAIAYCRGRLVYGASAEELRFAILWNQNMRLDFRQVESMDAAGLGMLAQLHVLATVMGTTIELCGLNRQIRHLLRISNLDSVLGAMGDEEGDRIEAVSA